jgi:hypothetical protein
MFETRDKRIEWACRALLTLQSLFVIRGYIVFLQTEYQLLSPLIPQSLIYDISDQYVIASLISGGFMLVSLWLYFINKKILSAIAGGASLLLSQLWFYLFAR